MDRSIRRTDAAWRSAAVGAGGGADCAKTISEKSHTMADKRNAEILLEVNIRERRSGCQ
jgi:hypothetical protein